jgi:hypothetical protein
MDIAQNRGCLQTRRALLWMHILNEPMVALYTLLPFILVKDFGAGPLEVSLFISLRPILTFFSYFWGINLSRKKSDLIPNVMTAYVLAYLPFAILSLTGNIWLILLSAGFYQLFYKAGLPGWIEVMQKNLPTQVRDNIFSLSFVLGFVISGTIGIFLGFLLDANPNYLRGLLSAFSVIGLSNFFLLKKIPQPSPTQESATPPLQKRVNFTTALTESLRLLRTTPDFWIFQVAFTLGAGSLMLMSPSLSLFYVSVLSLSHAQITLARFLFMALGVVASSFFWKQGLQRFHVNVLSIWLLIGFGFFALTMLIAQMHLYCLYLAFFLYGISQSGSHLVWNLSGPIFAKGNVSIPYTSVNLLMVGVRGLIFPMLGGIFATFLPIQVVIGIGMLTCFIGAFVLHKYYPQRIPKLASE